MSVFTLNLFMLSQWLTISKFSVIELVIFSPVLLLMLQVKVLPSAMGVNMKDLEHFGKSLMNIRNNRWPNMETRGTQDSNEQTREFYPFNDTNWFLRVK